MSRKFRITTGTTVRGGRVERKVTNWPTLVKRLSKTVDAGIKLTGYRELDTEQKAELKNAFGFFIGGYFKDKSRRKDALVAKSVLTLDLDFLESWDIDGVYEAYKAYEFLAHSSMSHSEDAPKLRLVFPLTRDVTLDEYEPMARKVAEWFDINATDKVSYRPAQLMYWPAHCSDVPPILLHNHGLPLDPDKILGEYDDVEDWGGWPRAERDGLGHPPAMRAEDPRTKRGVVGAFCRTYDIHHAITAFDLPYVRIDGSDRYTPRDSTGGAGAIVYDDGSFLYSHHSTDVASDKNLNAYDLVRLIKFGDLDEGFDGDWAKSPSQAGMQDFALRLPEVTEMLADESGFEDLGAVQDSDASISNEQGEKADKPKKPKLTFETVSKEIAALQHPKFEDCEAILPRIAASRLESTQVGVLASMLKDRYPDPQPTKADVMAAIKTWGDRLTAQISTDGEISDIEEDILNYVVAKHYARGKHLKRTGGAWWTFGPSNWGMDNRERVRGSVVETILHLRKDRPDDRPELVAFTGESPTSALSARLGPMFENYMAIRTGRDDPLRLKRSFHMPIINCLNGELHFDGSGDYELRPHDPDSFLTSSLDVAFDLKAKAPEWDRFIRTMFADHRDPEGMKRHLEEFCGYSIQMSRWLKVCAIMLGPGNNGKSTIADVLKTMLGDAALGRDLARYAGERKSEFAEFDLLGKLILIEDDLTKGVLLPDGWLKTISEEKVLTASVKYVADPVTFRNRAFPLILSNYSPVTRDLSPALRNRMQVFPMPHVFPVNDAGDARRHKMVHVETAGVLNRFVRGLTRLRARGGWDLPVDMKLAATTWAENCNPLSRFVVACLVLDAEIPVSRCVKAGDVKGAYYAWCSAEGIPPRLRLQRSHLFEQLAHLGLVHSGARQAGYHRIKGVVRVDNDSDDDARGEL